MKDRFLQLSVPQTIRGQGCGHTDRTILACRFSADIQIAKAALAFLIDHASCADRFVPIGAIRVRRRFDGNNTHQEEQYQTAGRSSYSPPLLFQVRHSNTSYAS